jgi:D-sedoheptulose 7-phosphate isomerase
VTSIANDYDFGECFERPLSALVRKGDVAVGLTGSGGSTNVARALRAARERGAFAIALTSAAKDPRGGPVGAAAELALVAPCQTVAEAQEIHLAVGHILCELIEKSLAGGRRQGR